MPLPRVAVLCAISGMGGAEFSLKRDDGCGGFANKLGGSATIYRAVRLKMVQQCTAALHQPCQRFGGHGSSLNQQNRSRGQ